MPDESWLWPAVAAFLDSRTSLLLAMIITTEKKEKRIHEELAGNDFQEAIMAKIFNLLNISSGCPNLRKSSGSKQFRSGVSEKVK